MKAVSMLSYKDALKIVLCNTRKLSFDKVLIEEAIGRLSAEDIYSEIDMPPFNKSAMDGYAVSAEDARKSPARLKYVGLIQAGEIFKGKVEPGECVKIMTGAAVPKGADSVVMVEDTTSSGKYVKIDGPVFKWQNICFKGEDIQKGMKVLQKNKIISSACIALLATVGRRVVKVAERPKVAILNTGGEIVPPGGKLSRGQIYNSNGPQLSALLRSYGIEPCYLGIVEDEPKELMRSIRRGLKSDIFLISGGVSMGDYDLVPGMLKRAGVKEVFHKVNIKPGKPLFFGKKGKTIIFGIPGNPVSNFLTYQLFIRPSIYRTSGYISCGPKIEKGILARPFRQKTGRTHFVLASVERKGGVLQVDPVSSHGSADVHALSKANGFMVVGKNVDYIRARSKVNILLW